jgi:opacity protein-like surface antigen
MIRPVLVLAILVVAPAAAEEPVNGFYLGADLAAIDAGSGRSHGLLAGTPEFVVRIFPETASVSGTDASWGIHAGYRINRYLAIELDYTDYGSMIVHQVYDLTSVIPDAPPTFENDVYFAAAGASLSWLASIPLGERFEAFVRVGVLHAEQDIEPLSFAVLPGESFFSEISENVPVYGIGAAYRTAGNWSLRLEYRHAEGLHGGNSIDGTDSVGPISLRRLGLGVSYAF